MQPLNVTLTEYKNAYRWVADYLAAYGISFTSPSWASEQAFRMQFTKPLTVSNPIGKTLLKASRGYCDPGHTYRGPIEKWDIRSAYPSAMLENAHQFPTKFVPIATKDWNKRPLTLVLAYVQTYGEQKFTSPLIQEHYTDTKPRTEALEWFWRFELETILDQGHHYVNPVAAFKVATSDLTDEIGGWLEILSPRYMDKIGFAGNILKGVTNALWGSYASGDINAYTWTLDEHGTAVTDRHVKRMFNGKIGSEHIAAWTNALVSDRVFKEFIEPERVLYFDTDGGFCYPSASALGNGDFGEWRYEGTYRKLKVYDWQAYAAWADNGIDVVLSGIPDASYKDLKQYGANQSRKGYLAQLIEDNPFNRIAAVHKEESKVTTIPPEVATLGDDWEHISPAIAPHVAHVGPSDIEWHNVSDRAALGFRTLAKFSEEIAKGS
ncbi:MAG: hypothetical protein GY771_05295 [bacterium]|nr:hypothetical protein [bacterium]